MSQAQQHVLASAIVLALLVVLCIHVFLFPMYTSSPATRRIKMSSYEQALCHDIYSRASKSPGNKHKLPSCPKYGIISAVQGGRLGNQIWEYGSVWATARRTGLEPYMPRCILKTLDEYFENLSIPSLSNIGQCIIDVGQIVNSLSEWNSTEQNIIIPKYAAYWSLILVWLDDFRQEFTFKRSLRRHAESVLKEASHNLSSPIYVGVHVRRTDYIDYLWQKLRVRPAPVSYYFNAMGYFARRYGPSRLVFLVASDNIAWCKYHLARPGLRIRFVSSNDAKAPGKDLAVLAACNHSVIDYGTYGAFGAVLAKGETVVYNVSTHFSTMIAEALPNWKIMT